MKNAILTILILSFSTFAYAGEATLNGKSYSIMFSDALINMDGYPVEFLFTTYDNNRYNYPYYYDSQSGIIYYSQELKKIGSLYYTDYYSLIYNTIDDFGEISLYFGNIDTDSNGIDDICEIDKSINVRL